MGGQCSGLGGERGSRKGTVGVKMPLGSSIEELVQIPLEKITCYLKLIQKLYIEEAKTKPTERHMKKEYKRKPANSEEAILVTDAKNEVDDILVNLQLLLNSGNKVIENPESLIRRAAYAISVNHRYLQKRGIISTTRKSLHLIQFMTLKPCLSRKKIHVLCALQETMNISKSGYVTAAELERYVNRHSKSTEITKSIFFNQIFAIPNNDMSFFTQRLNPIDFVQAIERICLSTEKELALLSWHALSFGTSEKKKIKHMARHQLQDGLILLPGDFDQSVHTDKLALAFKAQFSEGGTDYNEYNKTVSTVLSRVAMLKNQVAEGKRVAGFQKDHVKHGVRYVEAPKGENSIIVWKEWWTLCQSNDMLLYPLKVLQALLQKKTGGQQWWANRRRDVAATPQVLGDSDKKKMRGSIVVFTKEGGQQNNKEWTVDENAASDVQTSPARGRRKSAPVLRLREGFVVPQDDQSSRRKSLQGSSKQRGTNDATVSTESTGNSPGGVPVTGQNTSSPPAASERRHSRARRRASIGF